MGRKSFSRDFRFDQKVLSTLPAKFLSKEARRSLRLLSTTVIGWLLMFPPQAERSATPLTGPDVSAPIVQWQAMGGQKVGESGVFATKSDCEDYRSKMIPDAKEKLLDAPRDVEQLPSRTATVKWTFALGALKSRCISTDDPQLRPKSK